MNKYTLRSKRKGKMDPKSNASYSKYIYRPDINALMKQPIKS